MGIDPVREVLCLAADLLLLQDRLGERWIRAAKRAPDRQDENDRAPSLVEVVDPVLRAPKQQSADARSIRALEGRTDIGKLGQQIDGLCELIEEKVRRRLAILQPPLIDALELCFGLVNKDDRPIHRLERSSATTSPAGR